MFIEFDTKLFDSSDFYFQLGYCQANECFNIICYNFNHNIFCDELFKTSEEQEARWQQLKLILDIPIVLALKEQEEYDWKKHV